MSKQPEKHEWYTARDDADWARLSTQAMPTAAHDQTPAGQARRFSPSSMWEMTIVLICVASTVGWWRMTHTGAQEAATELRASVQQELESPAFDNEAMATLLIGQLPTTDTWRSAAQNDSSLPAALPTTAVTAYRLAVETPVVNRQGTQAVARTVLYTEQGAPAYRQTRFYRRTTAGWVRADPDVTLWGALRSLATPSFVFRFRENDASAVIAVAPQLEALYTTMRRNFGLPVTPGAEKLVIEVSVTQPPGQAVPWQPGPDQFIVASPAVYWAPVDLSDEELLAQSIVLPLVTDTLGQARQQYALPTTWEPLVSGLALWQLWDLDLPLAAWRAEIVTWVYADTSADGAAQALVLPEHYAALCAAHQLWTASPAQLGIPLLCVEEGDWEAWNYSLRHRHAPVVRLNQISMPAPSPLHRVPWNELDPDQDVALATLLEYAVATYGRERLPILLAGLGHYATWDTLLPAVYGVSSAEFEAGWQAYLAEHYAGKSVK